MNLDFYSILFSSLFLTFQQNIVNSKHFRESGYLISIHNYIIGNRINDKIIHEVMVKEIVLVHAQFICMRTTFQKLFSLPGVFSSVKDYMSKLEEETEILENFIQGQL